MCVSSLISHNKLTGSIPDAIGSALDTRLTTLSVLHDWWWEGRVVVLMSGREGVVLMSGREGVVLMSGREGPMDIPCTTCRMAIRPRGNLGYSNETTGQPRVQQ